MESTIRNVEVFVRGVQTPVGSASPDVECGAETDFSGQAVTVVKAVGSCRRVREALHFLYEEESKDGSPAGKVHVVLRGRHVEVHRRGEAEVDFVFEEGLQAEAFYKTPYMTIPMTVRTQEVRVSESDAEVRITLVYELFADKEKTADSVVEMRFCL